MSTAPDTAPPSPPPASPPPDASADVSRAQRRRTAALTIAIVVVAGAGAMSRIPWAGDAPAPCAAPALRDGMLVCDGNGSAPGARAWLAGHKLDVNRATASELELIPDVGPSLAQAIVDARAARGGAFGNIDELDDVAGVGPKTLAKLREWVTVGAP